MLSRQDHAELLRPVYPVLEMFERKPCQPEIVETFYPVSTEGRTTRKNVAEAICWDYPKPDEFFHGFDYGRQQAVAIDRRADLAGCIEALQRGAYAEFWQRLLSAQRGHIDQDVPLSAFSHLHLGARTGGMLGDFGRGFAWGFLIQAPYATASH